MIKSTNKIRSTKKTAMALLGILVAIVLLLQQPFTFNPYHHSSGKEIKKENKTENREDSSHSEYHIVAYQVLNPVLQFNLFHSFDLLIELPTLEEKRFSEYTPSTKVFLNFFQTLFRKIISPNAP